MKKNLLFLFFCCFTANLFAQDANIVQKSHITFPGQTLANICGYAVNGKEYALLGASKGMIIMDVTNPVTPKQINQYPGPDNLWKEIKTYKNYAYVTSEGGQGLQIIDLSTLPDTTKKYKFYTGDGAISGKLGKIHALHIDEKKGFVYCYGATGIAKGGAVIMDIGTDPWNPKYVGMYDVDYIHDGYAINDTLFGCHIYGGYFSIIDMSDKTKFKVINTQKTPTVFTHNAWLSDNHKTIFTTDENTGSYMGSYDISDPLNIKLLDKIRSNTSSKTPGSIVHNTHILNDFAINSYYKDGITIVDCHKPDNLVEVASFDTYPQGSGDGFEGAWGVYPFLPSGTIVVSNIDEGLYVLSPTYKRAAYLEGKVTDKDTKLALLDATISLDNRLYAATTSDIKGLYKTGLADEGTFDVVVSKAGYFPLKTKAILVAGKVTILDAPLEAEGYLNGVVVDAATNKGIPNAQIKITEATNVYETVSDANGNIKLPGSFKATYNVLAGAWGYKYSNLKNQTINIANSYVVKLSKGYEDSFEFDLGWTTEVSAANVTGKWTRGVPVATDFNGSVCNPGADSNDEGTQCYVTGNAGGAAGDDDVDNGTVTLTSPNIVSNSLTKTISYNYWFFNAGGSTAANDTLSIYTKSGNKKTLVQKLLNSNGWVSKKNPLYFADGTNFQMIFETSDNLPGHLVEAAIDNIQFGVISATLELDASLALEILPSPFVSTATMRYNLEQNEAATLKIFNTSGQLIEAIKLNSNVGEVEIGKNYATGTYIAQLFTKTGYGKGFKFVKM